MNRRRGRRALSILGAVVGATFAVTIVPAASAFADTPAAHLLVRGTGTYYSQADAVFRSVTPGQSVTFSYQVVNDESVPDQFRVSLIQECLADLTCTTTAQLYAGTTAVNGLTFITPLLAPGNSYTFTEKVTAPASAVTQREYRQVLVLSLDQQNDLDEAANSVSISPARGTQGNDLFITQGGQPQIGGDTGSLGANREVMASQAIRPGSSATFALTLKNNSPSAKNVAISLTSDPNCQYVDSIKVTWRLSADVTAAMFSNTFSVHLNAGASQSFSAAVKHLTAFTAACRLAGWTFETSDGTNTNSYVIAVPDGTGL